MMIRARGAVEAQDHLCGDENTHENYGDDDNDANDANEEEDDDGENHYDDDNENEGDDNKESDDYDDLNGDHYDVADIKKIIHIVFLSAMFYVLLMFLCSLCVFTRTVTQWRVKF